MISVHCALVSILVPTNADLAVSITTSHEKSDATRQRRYGRALGAMPLDHVGCGGAHACRQGRHIERRQGRSEEHTSELQSLMRISYAVFCLKKKKHKKQTPLKLQCNQQHRSKRTMHR